MSKLQILFIVPYFLYSGVNCIENEMQLKPLDITVLYSSLCPDSRDFIKDEFLPVFDEFQNYINLTLVPFGKSRRNGADYECQHGPEECKGNLLQDCALHATKSSYLQLKYVACQLENFNNTTDHRCINMLGLEESVEACLQSYEQSHKYQEISAKITQSYMFEEIPAIIFNNVFEGDLQQLARTNIRATICKKLMERQSLQPVFASPGNSPLNCSYMLKMQNNSKTMFARNLNFLLLSLLIFMIVMCFKHLSHWNKLCGVKEVAKGPTIPNLHSVKPEAKTMKRKASILNNYTRIGIVVLICLTIR